MNMRKGEKKQQPKTAKLVQRVPTYVLKTILCFLKGITHFKLNVVKGHWQGQNYLECCQEKKNYDLLRHSNSVPRMRRIMYLPYPDHYNKTLLHQTLYF